MADLTRSIQPLPVVLYPPSGSVPGASHAVGRTGPRSAFLLWGIIGLLPLLFLLLGRTPQQKITLVRKASVALPVLPSPVPARPERRWDAALGAHPVHGQFLRFFRMRVTAYTPINTRMEGGRYTCTQRDGRLAHGVAVDPSLIPLGSHLWIPGYGHAVADDVGGAIRGHHVDLRIQDRSRMAQWGTRQARVYVLQDPGMPHHPNAAARRSARPRPG